MSRNSRYLYRWLLFSILSLVFAGVFAFFAAMARTPAVKLLPSTEFFKVALVTHVIFAVVVWFLGFEAVLWCYCASRLGELKHRGLGMGLYPASAGMALIALSALLNLGRPLLIDYFPLLEHPAYFAGLILVAIGVGTTIVAYISHVRTVQKLNLAGYGMLLTGFIILITFLSFFSSAFINGANYRALVWGPGHVFQVASTLAMVVAWFILLEEVLHARLDSPLIRRLMLLYLLVAMLMPGIYFFPRGEQYELFTKAMMYGIALPSIPLALIVIRALTAPAKLPLHKPELSSLVLSLLLFGVGGAMGFFITGADLRVPAHYHGVLGAVTLAFMGMSYLMLKRLNIAIYSQRIARLQPYLYGIGLLLIILGLFWAGTYNAPRKTAGYEDPITAIAMNVMGFGSIIAVLGGAAFVANVLLALLRANR